MSSLNELLQAHANDVMPIEDWWDQLRVLLKRAAVTWQQDHAPVGYTELQALVRESTPTRLALGAWEFLQDLCYEEPTVASAYQRLVRLQSQEQREVFEEKMFSRLRAQLQPKEVRAQHMAERRKRIHEMVRQLRDRQYLTRVRDQHGISHESQMAVAKALHHYLGGVGLGWVKASPGRLPTVRAAFPAGPDWAAVPGCPVTRPTGLLTAPRPRGGARGREMPPCLCVCALVCLRGGGGGLWHTCLLHCCSALAHMARGSVCLVLQAPAGRLESLTLSPPGEMWAWARNLHVTRTCYPTTPRLPIGTGRRWYVARLGSDPHSLTALGTGGAASRAGSGSHGRGRTLGRWRGTRAQSVLPCPGCHQCWLHWLRRYSPRRRGGPEGTTPEWPLR